MVLRPSLICTALYCACARSPELEGYTFYPFRRTDGGGWADPEAQVLKYDSTDPLTAQRACDADASCTGFKRRLDTPSAELLWWVARQPDVAPAPADGACYGTYVKYGEPWNASIVLPRLVPQPSHQLAHIMR